MKGFYQKFSDILGKIITKKYDVVIEPPLWEVPQRQGFGDLSSMAALKLASKLKEDPLSIATDLKVAFEKEIGTSAQKIEILKPGFINVFISRQALLESLNDLLKEKDKFFRKTIKRSILLEFASANPTGPLSIAHGRQAVIGDVIANILKFYGNTIVKEYYINDEGRQLSLFFASVEARIKEIKGEPFNIPEDGYLGEYLKDVAQTYLDKGRGKDLRDFSLSHILSWIKKDLASLGVEFDSWISQKKLITEGEVEKAINLLREKELIYENEGVLWFASTKFGDDKDRVIKKSDGELTYFASDIAYHWDKLQRKFDMLINLWGPDHHGYIERVKGALEALGYSREVLNVIIVQLVSLKTKEKMSKRKGTAVLLSDLIEEVGKDAARFYYLLRRNSSQLEFDVELAQEATLNNPLYYVQYASARIESIFAKVKAKTFSCEKSAFLKEENEINYLRSLLQFSNCLDKAYYSLEPVFVVEFLKLTAANFHKFYETTRVLGENEDITGARLNLLEATRIILHCGLDILGIKPVKKM
ncbi:MAG: arginine--tRNA ligase [Candidatus Omnitrophica bacterium]|nr:arginine--tRNA ligase [Candidatus Omnitrophota bacterium]